MESSAGKVFGVFSLIAWSLIREISINIWPLFCAPALIKMAASSH
jgi:hypothetical protein